MLDQPIEMQYETTLNPTTARAVERRFNDDDNDAVFTGLAAYVSHHVVCVHQIGGCTHHYVICVTQFGSR